MKEKETHSNDKPSRKPINPDARESQLINSALNLVQKQIDEGTVPAVVLAKIVQWGSQREQLDKQVEIKRLELFQAKIDALEEMKADSNRWVEVQKALSSYRGEG